MGYWVIFPAAWGSTIKSPQVCTVTNRCPSCYDLRCCQDVKTPTNQPMTTTPLLLQSMRYTAATIMECQRMGNIALFSVPRCTTEDTEVNGYHIPRGTWVFVNRWGLHASARYWPDPGRFDPGRFLDKEGRVFTPEAFSPFGVGESDWGLP